MPVFGDNTGQDYMKSLVSISDALRPIDPRNLELALGSGGSFEKSLGFNSGRDMLGLTPAQVDEVIANRGSILNQNIGTIKSLGELGDMLSGNKELRSALTSAQGDVYRAGQQKELTGMQLQNTREIADKDRSLTESHYRATEKQAENQLAFERERLETESKLRKLEEAGRSGRASQELQLKKEELKLKAEELKAMKPSIEAKDITGTLNALADAKKAAYKSRPKDYFTYHMMEAGLRAEPGSIYKTYGYKDQAQGWENLQLGSDNNWYGVEYADGKLVKRSQTPIVYGAFSALGETKMTKKYGGK